MAPPIHNLPSECRTPFDPGDFQRLDTTPDGSLSYGPGNEITPDALECFISRYLHTARQARDIFSVGTALWEAMRTRLQQLAGANTLPTLSAEIAYLLEHQFSQRIVFASGTVATQHEGASSVSDFNTMHEALTHRTHSLEGAGAAGIRLNLGEAWRLATSLMLLGSQRWGEQEIISCHSESGCRCTTVGSPFILCLREWRVHQDHRILGGA